MADFTIDSAAFESWASTLQNSVKYTSQAKNNLVDMQGAVKDLTEQFSALNLGKDFINEFKEIQTMFKEISGSLSTFSSELHNLSISAELKRSLDAILKTINETKKSSEHDKKEPEKEHDKKEPEKQNTFLAKNLASLKQQGAAVGKWVAGLGGIQFSLVGILALFLKIHNETNRIHGYSTQIAAQMGGPLKSNIGAAVSTLGQMQAKFALSYDDAAKHLNTLAKTGMEMDTLKNAAIELYAIQSQGGLSIQEQATGVNRLMTEFNLTGKAARDYNILLHNTAKTMDGLSISQVASDLTEMQDSIRGYNTDLLGTVSLYNALTRKDIAKQLGLGDMPQEFRRDLAKTAASFGKDMEDGWKVFLGKGDNFAKRLLEFERADPGEQLARAVTGAQKLAAQSGQSMEVSLIKMRKVFSAMGIDEKTVARGLADATLSGEFNVDKFKAVMEKSRKENEKSIVAAEDSRKALINLGTTIERSLASLEKRLEQWVNNTLRPVVTSVVNAIDRLISALKISFMDKFEDFADKYIVHPTKQEDLADRRKATQISEGQVSGYRHRADLVGLSDKKKETIMGTWAFQEIEKQVAGKHVENSSQVALGMIVQALRDIGYDSILQNKNAAKITQEIFKIQNELKQRAETYVTPVSDVLQLQSDAREKRAYANAIPTGGLSGSKMMK